MTDMLGWWVGRRMTQFLTRPFKKKIDGPIVDKCSKSRKKFTGENGVARVRTGDLQCVRLT